MSAERLCETNRVFVHSFDGSIMRALRTCGIVKFCSNGLFQVRKNDKKSFQRMRELRLNFDRARTILELMKQREKLKKDR